MEICTTQIGGSLLIPFFLTGLTAHILRPGWSVRRNASCRRRPGKKLARLVCCDAGAISLEVLQEPVKIYLAICVVERSKGRKPLMPWLPKLQGLGWSWSKAAKQKKADQGGVKPNMLSKLGYSSVQGPTGPLIFFVPVFFNLDDVRVAATHAEATLLLLWRIRKLSNGWKAL